MPHRVRSTCLCLTVLAACTFTVPVAAGAQPPNDDDKHYRTGLGLLNKGLSDLAASELRAYLRENPAGAQAVSARYALAVCLLRQNQHAEARTELEPVLAVRDFEFAADALLLSAQCATAAGDDGAAAGALARVLAEYPKFAQRERAAELLGEAHYRGGNYKRALEALATTKTERGGLFAAMAEMNLREFGAAAKRAGELRTKNSGGAYAVNLMLIEAQCRRELGELPAAAGLYKDAAAAAGGPVRTQALLGLAQVARAQREWAVAGQALSEAASVAASEADAGKPSGELGVQVALERAKLLLDTEKAAAALKVLSQVSQVMGEAGSAKGAMAALGAETMYWSAKCEAKLGKHAEAAERLKRGAAEYPASELRADMLFDRAAALGSAGKDEQALAAWTAWRKEFASSELMPAAVSAQAWCAHRMGKFEDSLELCAALRADNSSKAAGAAASELTGLLVAENQFGAGRFEAALAAYGELLARYPQTAHASRAMLRRTLCLLKLDRADEAGQALEAVVGDLAPADAALRRAAVLTLAEALFAKQEWSKSEKWFAVLAAGAPGGESSVDALLRQAIAVERQGRFAEALVLLERLLSIAPGAPQALQGRFELGQTLIELGRLEEAASALQQVVADEQPAGALTPHALRHLATIASRQGRPAEAARILAQLRATGEPSAAGSAATLNDLAAALLAAGDFAGAEKALVELLKTQRGAGAVQARCRLAIAMNRQGRAAEALKELEGAGDLAGLDAETRAAAKYERALALRSLSREGDAAAALRELLGEPPSRLEAYAAMDLAQVESKAGRHEQALVLVTRLLAAAERLEAAAAGALRERGTYLRGAALVALGKPGEAAEVLKDFAKSYPSSTLGSAAALMRAEALMAGGDAKGAAAELERAVAGAPSAEVRAAAMLRLGEAAAAGQNWAASEKAYAGFLEAFATSELWFSARFGQGWARENQGRHEAAMEAYRDVVARHKGPTAARAQFQIGECLYAQKKYEAAVVELLKTEVLFDYPEWSAAALFEAGRCFAELGRQDDAAKQFTDVTTRFPQTRWATMAQERLSASKPAPLPGRGGTAAAPSER